MTDVTYLKKDSGLDRVYYKSKDNRLFCIQQGEWFRCSQDGEPSHQVFNMRVVAPKAKRKLYADH